MKTALRGLAFGLTLILSIWTTASAQEPKEVFAPTTLIESSPQIAGVYHRISGKIEASVSNPALAEQLQDRFGNWLDAAGEKSPTTYDVAHDRLMEKLSAVNAAFDAARASGSFDNWPTSTRAGSPAPASMPQAPAMVAASSPSQAATPTHPPAPEPPLASEVASPPAVATVQTAAPAPSVKPAAPSQTPEAKSAAQAQKDPAATAPSETSQPGHPLWLQIITGVFVFIVALAFWKIYPRVFQPRADTYSLSAWGRFKKRAIFTAISTFVAIILLVALVPQ